VLGDAVETIDVELPSFELTINALDLVSANQF